MSLTITKKISLDFYNNNIVSINVKQLDTQSRYINITCTDSGKKITLNKDSMSVYVGYKKTDGNNCFYEAEILDDGTILLEIKEQMVVVSGRQQADVYIVATGDTVVENLSDISSISELGVAIISTMPFYINVIPTLVNHSEVVSNSDMDALNEAISRLAYAEQHIKEVDDTASANEEIRQANETAREEAETARQATIEEAKSVIVSANNATEDCNTATSNANTATQNAIAATASANEAASSANSAAERCQEIIDEVEENGAVLNSQVGVANGVASLDSNGIVPSSQLPFSVINNTTTTTTGNALDAYQGYILKTNITSINELISTLQTTINNLPSHYSGTSDPSSSLGKNGDVYFKIIEE